MEGVVNDVDVCQHSFVRSQHAQQRATRCDAMRSMEALPFLCLPTRPLLCFALLVCPLVLVASSATSGAPQHAFLSLVSQLTFSCLLAHRVRVRDARLLAVCSYHRQPTTGRPDTARACFGTYLAVYSIPLTVHSFSNKNTRSPPSLRHLETILSHLSDPRFLPKRSVHRRAPYCTERQALGMN